MRTIEIIFGLVFRAIGFWAVTLVAFAVYAAWLEPERRCRLSWTDIAQYEILSTLCESPEAREALLRTYFASIEDAP